MRYLRREEIYKDEAIVTVELESTEYDVIRDMANTFGNHKAVIDAVISGSEPGCIFVDRRAQPTCFFVHEYDGFFFLHPTFRK